MSEAAARPVLAASIAVLRGPSVLLIQRAKPPAKGLYTLPGGRIEPGETLHAGVLRELAEEVGIDAEIAAFVDHVEMIERDSAGTVTLHAVIAAFAGRWRAGEARPSDEVSDLRWVDPFAPGNLPMTPGLPGVLARAARLAMPVAP